MDLKRTLVSARLGRIERVTPERLANRANYRSQLNVDRRLWAYGYNALVARHNTRYMYNVRNYLTDLIDRDLRKFLKRHIAEDPEFARSLQNYMDNYVDERLHDDALSLYRELGWKRSTSN